MVCEVTVTVKNEEKSLKTKYLIYEDLCVNQDDPIIKNCVEQAVKNFSDEHDKIGVRINLEVV